MKDIKITITKDGKSKSTSYTRKELVNKYRKKINALLNRVYRESSGYVVLKLDTAIEDFEYNISKI